MRRRGSLRRSVLTPSRRLRRLVSSRWSQRASSPALMLVAPSVNRAAAQGRDGELPGRLLTRSETALRLPGVSERADGVKTESRWVPRGFRRACRRRRGTPPFWSDETTQRTRLWPSFRLSSVRKGTNVTGVNVGVKLVVDGEERRARARLCKTAVRSSPSRAKYRGARAHWKEAVPKGCWLAPTKKLKLSCSPGPKGGRPRRRKPRA